ncbi:U7 snRNA-associated Sm-like protein LSm11 [Syngnathus acus]|uniref:U7 snRNA-associated Sm-like protein LSm11 n=1 Tax=Syngnathus acus TaxID=161584 RepID=UPI0018860AF3|nr:U7 snRNA-associated Sm-like protein LSm11 [Syngnathus acus]
MEEKERDRRSRTLHRQEKDSASNSGASSGPRDDDTLKIDVCSERFDPLLALYSTTVPLPFPNIKCFNNIAEYESFLKGGRGRAKPENVEKRRIKALRGVADPERIERLKKLMVNKKSLEEEEEEEEGGSSSSSRAQQSRRRKPQKNVLTRMTLCKGSPLGELHRCVEQRIRVKVHIRTFKGLRGVCSGFVVAFDKFWNLAMVDVDETYREPLLGKALYHEKALTISRLFEKLKLQESSGGEGATTKHRVQVESGPARHRSDDKSSEVPKGTKAGQEKECRAYGKVHTRHINQLFIRGENVLLVNPQPL